MGRALEEVLARVGFLEAASAEGLRRLARASELRTLARGGVLFLEGDPAERFFVVVEGWVKVYKGHPEGDRQIVLHLEGPGSPLAEVAVFLDEARYPASAEAATPARVLAVPKATFLELLEAEPAVARGALRLLGTVPEIVSRKLWKLYREGLIELDGRRVVVTEPAYLLAKFMPRRR